MSCVQSKTLLEAVQKNRVAEVQTRLRWQEDVDTIFTMGRTALHCAAANSFVEIVSTLLMYSPNVQLCDSNGYSPLHMACSRSGPASVSIIEKLLAVGAEVDSANTWGRTPLHECVVSNNVEGARRLLEAGASKDMGDSQGVTPQAMAVRMNRPEILQLICWVDPEVGASSENKSIKKILTASEEREALTKRLEELKEDQIKELEMELMDKKLEVEKTKKRFSKLRGDSAKLLELARNEVIRLEREMAEFEVNERLKCVELEKEIDKLATEICVKKMPEENKYVVKCLECPVCLDVCKPPLQVWQCAEGHIICGTCKARPELRTCPQCRMVLSGALSRNRALEELARKTFQADSSGTGCGGGGSYGM